MSTQYLPRNDSGLASWAANFTAKIGLYAVAFGLTPDEVTAYTDVQTDYAAKLAAATNPDTRGPATVLAKNLAKKALSRESRLLAMAVTNRPGVTDEQRQACGLTVRDTQPTPVPVPEVEPQLDVVSVSGRRVSLRLRDASNGERRKPTGVQGATLVSYVGPTIPESVRDWTFEANTTRTDADLVFGDSIPMGTMVWVSAFWYNRRGESGPACAPVSMHLGFGALSESDLSSQQDAA